MKLNTNNNFSFIYKPFQVLFQFLIHQKENIYDLLIEKLYTLGDNTYKQSNYIYLGINMIKLIISITLFIEVYS